MTTYSDWADIPDDTDSAVFSLLWGRIKEIIRAADVGDLIDLADSPGWEVQEDDDGLSATPEGWSYAVACALTGGGGKPPETREDYPRAWLWQRWINNGVDVAHEMYHAP